MRVFTLIFLLLLNAGNLCAQDNKSEKHFYFDSAWQPIAEKKARYHVRKVKLGDTAWRIDTYNYFGPIIRTGTYRDENATIAHGTLAWYNTRGVLDSSRNFFDGQPHGTWFIRQDTTLIEVRRYYRGQLIKTEDAATYRSTLRSSTTPLADNEKESRFPGGDAAWQRYLNNNLKYSDKLIKRELNGTVRARFVVGPSGYVTEALLENSVAMLADDQLLNLVRNSPKWEPATINGKPVNSYKRQHLEFKLQREGGRGRKGRL